MNEESNNELEANYQDMSTDKKATVNPLHTTECSSRIIKLLMRLYTFLLNNSNIYSTINSLLKGKLNH